jgi:hypothetical protein
MHTDFMPESNGSLGASLGLQSNKNDDSTTMFIYYLLSIPIINLQSK